MAAESNKLPWPMPRTKWIMAGRLPPDVRRMAEAELHRATKAPGWNPKVIHVRRKLFIIDVCGEYGRDDLHSAEFALLQDHPFLDRLNALPHVPRAVKSIYRRETRLAFERASSGWHFSDAWAAAEAAWREWLDNAAALR